MRSRKYLQRQKNSRRLKRLFRFEDYSDTVSPLGLKRKTNIGSLASSGLFLRRVAGDSMAPSLSHGQILVCWKTPKAQVNDIVIVLHDGMEKVKRLADVRTHHIYLLGDNPSSSTDSRHIGWLPKVAIIGKVIWPKTFSPNLEEPK